MARRCNYNDDNIEVDYENNDTDLSACDDVGLHTQVLVAPDCAGPTNSSLHIHKDSAHRGQSTLKYYTGDTNKSYT